MPQIYTYSDELTHYGRLGMKWGQHIFGKERYARMTQKRALKKARKTRAKKQKEKAAKAKSDAELIERKKKILSDPYMFEKNKHLFTTEEIKAQTERYKAEQELSMTVNKMHEERIKKLNRGQTYVKELVDYTATGINAYNNIARIYNTFSDPGSTKLPLINDKPIQQAQQQQNQNNQQQQNQQNQNKKKK